MEVQTTATNDLINIHNLSNNSLDPDWSFPLNGNVSSLVNKLSEAETENWNRNHKLLTNAQKNTMTCKTDKLKQPNHKVHYRLPKLKLLIAAYYFQNHRPTDLTVTPRGFKCTEDKIIDCSSNSPKWHILSNLSKLLISTLKPLTH